jgi:hypothetical protein
MVVAVFSGERPSAGYSIRILSATISHETPPVLVVRYEQTAPRSGMNAAVLTQPYQLKVLPRFDGKVRFEEEKAPK